MFVFHRNLSQTAEKARMVAHRGDVLPLAVGLRRDGQAVSGKPRESAAS
jgi:hypothetical protein